MWQGVGLVQLTSMKEESSSSYWRCVRYGWIGGQRNGWFAKVDNVFLRLGGFAKVDNRFGYEKWLQGGSIGL